MGGPETPTFTRLWAIRLATWALADPLPPHVTAVKIVHLPGMRRKAPRAYQFPAATAPWTSRTRYCLTMGCPQGPGLGQRTRARRRAGRVFPMERQSWRESVPTRLGAGSAAA